MDNRIGTCSECGGPVVMPNMMVNPVAHCERCGATAKNPHGPVIPMVPRSLVEYPNQLKPHVMMPHQGIEKKY